MADIADKHIRLSQMPMQARDWYILAVASMEQVIGAALSTIVGIMIPLILLLGAPKLSALAQGVLGAAGLVGIAAGSMIIGRLMDLTGYLLWFRLCPLIIACGSAGVLFASDSVGLLTCCLFVIGLGVGGGYSLDAGYISELMPTRWQSFFVGLAKATCSLGFIGGAAVGWLVLKADPDPDVWPWLICLTGILGIVTFIFRIRWYQSPRWLMAKGETGKAEQAARDFMGPEAEIRPEPPKKATPSLGMAQMFEGDSLKKVILSGVSWACEGLGVYGFGVFLPILVMSLGLQPESASGIPKILGSVQTTVFINLFIAAGFALGLAILHKVNILKLMGWCFIICAICLAVLLAAHELGWPVWVGFLCFVVFEIALNAGPHLVTYVVPSRIYSIEERGAGTGIATMFGKIGAVLGVFFMPVLLSGGGIMAVMLVSILVQLIGAAVTFIYGRELKLL